jgi:hypothetical protein
MPLRFILGQELILLNNLLCGLVQASVMDFIKQVNGAEPFHAGQARGITALLAVVLTITACLDRKRLCPIAIRPSRRSLAAYMMPLRLSILFPSSLPGRANRANALHVTTVVVRILPRRLLVGPIRSTEALRDTHGSPEAVYTSIL